MSYCLPPGLWGIWWKAIKFLHISRNEAKINPWGHGINVLWPTNKLWADTRAWLVSNFWRYLIFAVFCWEKNWSYKEHMARFTWILISPEQGIKLSKWISNWLFLTLKWKRTNHWIGDVAALCENFKRFHFHFFPYQVFFQFVNVIVLGSIHGQLCIIMTARLRR